MGDVPSAVVRTASVVMCYDGDQPLPMASAVIIACALNITMIRTEIRSTARTRGCLDDSDVTKTEKESPYSQVIKI